MTLIFGWNMIVKRFNNLGLSVALLVAAVCFISQAASHAVAQDAVAQEASPATRKDPSRQVQTPFAPGILTVIPPAPDPEETVDGPLTLTELLETYPEIKLGSDSHPGGEPHFDARSRTLLEMAKQARFEREIYCFEFAFKPLRHFLIDVPGDDGRMQRKLIWYMVYRVRYRGGDIRPANEEVAGTELPKRVEGFHYDARYFFPMFKLVDHSTGNEYLDRILPSITPKIKTREKITVKLHNSVEISKVSIPFSADESAPGVWGVVTWEDVDPNVDFVSVIVYGLTNAFQIDELGGDAPYRRKALQLNFYRPGDAINQTEDKIRFGVPAFQDPTEQAHFLKQYNLSERLDYRWLFR
jgi:hypothetical protein